MAKLKSLTIDGQKFAVDAERFKEYYTVGAPVKEVYDPSLAYAEVLGIKLTNNQSIMNFFTTHQAKFNNAVLFGNTDLIYNTGNKLYSNINASHLVVTNTAEDVSLSALRSSSGATLFVLATLLGIRTKFREIGDDFDILYDDITTELGKDYATTGIREINFTDYILLNTPGNLSKLVVRIVAFDAGTPFTFIWNKESSQQTAQEFLSSLTPSSAGLTTAFATFGFVFEKIK